MGSTESIPGVRYRIPGGYQGLLFFIAVILFAPVVISNEYYLGVLVFAALNCITCIGLSLLMGYAGQISIGHAAFNAIGAYSSAILTARYGWSPFAALGVGVCLSVIVAIAVGVPSLRLKGHYLAMATLGFGTITHLVAVAALPLTGGPEGISDIPPISVFGILIDSDFKFYYLAWGCVAGALALALNLIHSRAGRGLRAIHGSEAAASSLGVNISLYKIQVFLLSAGLASFSGSLYAHYVSYIDPGPFGVMHSVLLVTMVAVGGMHRIWGAVLGSVLLSLIPEMLSAIGEFLEEFDVAYNPDFDVLIYGLILLVIMLFLPEGLFAGIVDGLKWLKEKLFSHGRAPENEVGS